MRRREEITMGLGKVQDTSVKTAERKSRKKVSEGEWYVPFSGARQYLVNAFGGAFPMTPERW